MKHEFYQFSQNYKHLQVMMEEVLEVRYTDLERQLVLCQELLRLSTEEGCLYGRAFALVYLGDYYIALNNGQLAGEYLKQASVLCQNQPYISLCMNLNIFYGLYYVMMMDQAMSLTCTLEALDYASQLDDHFRTSVILNNIANMFETFGDMEAAKSYYYKGFKCLDAMDKTPKNTPHYALLVANLIHLSCISGEIEQAEIFFKEFDYMDLTLNDQLGQYLISCCHLAAFKKDLAAVRSYTDRMITLLNDQSLWGYQFFEIVMHIVNFMLDFQDKEYGQKAIAALDMLCGENEPGNQLRAQKLRVRFYELFGTDQEQSTAYKRYYKLKEIVDITNNKTMSIGLHAKISLRNAAKEQAEMQKIAEQLEVEAQYDELTQIYNRRFFTLVSDRLANNPAVVSLGVVMIDLDYFKQYNDTYGHPDGDVVLCAVAEYMQQAAAGNPNVFNFRYGGDEFMCLYENCSESDLENYVSTLATLIRQRHIPHQESLCSDIVTLSIGFHQVERANGTALNVAALLAQADKALYWTKGRGRNSASKYSSEMESVLQQPM